MFQHSWVFWGIVLLALAIGLMMVPGIREILKGTFGRVLIPAFLAILGTAWRWGIWMLKEILEAHAILLKNLFSPHSVIFPTLEKESED
ncbi:hypothetical protein BAE30_08555 [Acidithiobacillus caldus]|jgi:hypothetical protein|uniref:Uncharacterized protein n=1 Tax=Acidithiobacillus caldus TaxID=33059 RepID=A0A1E7YVE5_9PROT|nr:hypothetical protein BAE30_08555 [Acidithiobacillus caldus]